MLKFEEAFLSLFRQGIAVILILFGFNALAIADQRLPARCFCNLLAVVDGDTIHANGHKIRLLGIDTPEINQMCQTKDGGMAMWKNGA